MNSNKIPKSFIVFIVVFVAFIVCVFALLMPMISNMPAYNQKHDEAVANIAHYEEILATQKTVEQKIEELTTQYNDKQAELFVDAETSIEDLQSIFKKLGIDMVSLNRGTGSPDAQGRTSTGGIPLYSTDLSFTFNGTVTTANKLVHYLEQESKGCYFINSLNMSPIEGGSNYTVVFGVTLYYFDATQTAVTQPATDATGVAQ